MNGRPWIGAILYIEEPRGHARRAERLRLTRPEEREAAATGQHHLLEQVGALAPVEEITRHAPNRCAPGGRIVQLERDEAIWFVVRQRLQHGGVHNGEDGGVGANSEREGRDCRKGEPRGAPEVRAAHRRSCHTLSMRVSHPTSATQSFTAARLPSSIRAARAASSGVIPAAVFASVDACRELAELGVEVLLLPPSADERLEASGKTIQPPHHSSISDALRIRAIAPVCDSHAFVRLLSVARPRVVRA